MIQPLTQEQEPRCPRRLSGHSRLVDFCETPIWSRLADVLNGTGGCYGLSGPLGAGKTWLMLRAIKAAQDRKGLGLWFPCPGAYEASEFLAALSETLAVAVQQHFGRDTVRAQAMRWLQFSLVAVVGLPVAIAVVVYLVRGLGKAGHGSLMSVFPDQVWAVVAVAAALLGCCSRPGRLDRPPSRAPATGRDRHDRARSLRRQLAACERSTAGPERAARRIFAARAGTGARRAAGDCRLSRF